MVMVMDQVKVILVNGSASGFMGHYLIGFDVVTPTPEENMQAHVSHPVGRAGGLAMATWRPSGPSNLMVPTMLGFGGKSH